MDIGVFLYPAVLRVGMISCIHGFTLLEEIEQGTPHVPGMLVQLCKEGWVKFQPDAEGLSLAR